MSGILKSKMSVVLRTLYPYSAAEPKLTASGHRDMMATSKEGYAFGLREVDVSSNSGFKEAA